jgi:GTP cyclohydrolase I/GTP cyclohydrolase-4
VEVPAVPRIGVTNVEKVVRIGDQLYHARIECFVEPGLQRAAEVIHDVIGSVVLGGGGTKVEHMAQRIAGEARGRSGAVRADVTIAVRYPEHKPAPASGIPTQEIYTLLGTAAATERGIRRLVGVSAQGITASPRGRQSAAERLAADGFSEDEIARILAAVPVATHNQRGLGTLHLGIPEDIDVDAAELLAIVEGSMSSEIYELMKRSDERVVVEKAARAPRRVEDCVREAIRAALERFGGLGDDVFIAARQENFETIHAHSVIAERFGVVGELRRDAAQHTTMREWLSAAGSNRRRGS